MYSVVLMAALATSSGAPEFGHHRGGCNGCYGGYASCYGCYGGCWGGCNGCYGGYASCHGGYGACFGYYSGWNCHGCFGCYGSYASPYATWGCYGVGYAGWGHGGCTGCYGCYGGHSAYGVPLPVDTGVPVQADPVTPNVRPQAPVQRPEVVPPPAPKDKLKIEETRAKVRFELPADARLYVDGVLIKTDAPARVFQTPALDPSKVYYYDVRVELQRDGQTVSDTQRLVVRPGQEVTASFANLEQRAPVATARTK